ncbi:hypothetical protein RJ640_009521 [Escallonia rubra]|uniref:Uncharacterized protein n=1 Tax=Escallonia rubra TaxID=112253 RepID=A0AA88R1D3_9ASTE|nr:hypothetical protein RJ640_009521 [Escallonia rubra]
MLRNGTCLVKLCKTKLTIPSALPKSLLSPLPFHNHSAAHSTASDFLGKVQEMAKDSDKRITRLLFCGPHFPASTNYTREYLCKYPFIQGSMTSFECLRS